MTKKLYKVLVTRSQAEEYEVMAFSEEEAMQIFTEGDCVDSQTIQFEAEHAEEVEND
tara:strand:+ start:26 stop:196 length:171 start_codon:yes stop_codon:yes gene_type:complete